MTERGCGGAKGEVHAPVGCAGGGRGTSATTHPDDSVILACRWALLADRSEFTQDNGQAVCMGRRIAGFLLSDPNLPAMVSLKMVPNQA